MKTPLKRNIFIIIESLFFSFLLFSIFNYFTVWKYPSAENIFDNSKNSVVELKCQKDDLITYGSAVFFDDDGTMISNAHMVTYKCSGIYEEYEIFEIRFCFENDYRSVSLIKYDISNDLAVLKLENTDGISIMPYDLGNSDALKAGEKVYAVGNGMNHGLGISQGIIGVPKVNIVYDETNREVIQCDLAINDGNSGGALLNKMGKLIGITTFRLKDNSGNVIYGTSYSIPINISLDYYYS